MTAAFIKLSDIKSKMKKTNKTIISFDKLKDKGQTCWATAAFFSLNSFFLISSKHEWVNPHANPSSLVQKDQCAKSYWAFFDPKERKNQVGVLQLAA